MIRIVRRMVSISVIGFTLFGSQVWGQEVGNPEAGLAVARRICSECHAVQEQEDHSPKSTAPHFVYIANVPGMTAIALSVALQRSHRTMPNIILDANETRDVIRYILSLQRAK
ncbi:MAG TPA: cytochrome C [Xanthobacteraceae bacterium]|nr:cytochrome C [Xanthobacteraceae bacterium]